MKKFSELSPKDNLEDDDYLPIVDVSESNLEQKNKVVLFSRIKSFLMKDVDAAEAARVQAENARVQAETARVQAENARGDKEIGYVSLSESYAHGTGNVARNGDSTDNSKYYSTLAAKSAEKAAQEAELASKYSNVVIPRFHLDLETMVLYQDTDGEGVVFELSADKHLMYEFTV